MNITTEATTTITLTLSPDDAARIIADFNHHREPSGPSKALISALAKARGKTTSERWAEALGHQAANPTPAVSFESEESK